MQKISKNIYWLISTIFLLYLIFHFRDRESEYSNSIRTRDFNTVDYLENERREVQIVRLLKKDVDSKLLLVLRIPKFCCNKCIEDNLDSLSKYVNQFDKINFLIAGCFDDKKHELIFRDRYVIQSEISIINLHNNLFYTDRYREPFIFVLMNSNILTYYRCKNNPVSYETYFNLISELKN